MGGGYGGINPSCSIKCYDPVNNLWRYPIHTSYYHFAMAVLNNRLLIAGGSDKYSNKTTNQILTMDSGRLNNYIKMNIPRSGAVAAGHQGMLLITGGEDDIGQILSSTELFDGNNEQWYVCNDLPQPHTLLKSVIVDNTIYLLGGMNKGGDSSPAVFTARLDNLSQHQLKWSTTQDTPWCGSAPVSVNGTHLLIVGGYKIKENEYTCSSDIYKLSKITYSWEAIGHIPSPRKPSAAVSTADNTVIIIGGMQDKGKCTNIVWIGSCEPQ